MQLLQESSSLFQYLMAVLQQMFLLSILLILMVSLVCRTYYCYYLLIHCKCFSIFLALAIRSMTHRWYIKLSIGNASQYCLYTKECSDYVSLIIHKPHDLYFVFALQSFAQNNVIELTDE